MRKIARVFLNRVAADMPMQSDATVAYGAGITLANYDVTMDGERFVMVKDDDSLGRLRVILNWRADAEPPAGEGERR